MKFFVEDLEAIREELKIEKLNILAHSWGAVLATHFAMTYLGRVNKIIYSNPTMLSREFDQDAALISKKKMLKEDSIASANIMKSGNLDVKKYDQLLHIQFNTSAYDRSHMEKLNLNLPTNFAAASGQLYAGFMKSQESFALNLYDSLKRLQFPVLIIHGEADVIPKSSIDKLRNSFPKAELIIFTKSGHFPFVEEREKYVGIVTDFFRRKK